MLLTEKAIHTHLCVFILCVCVCARVSGFNGRLAYRMDSGSNPAAAAVRWSVFEQDHIPKRLKM